MDAGNQRATGLGKSLGGRKSLRSARGKEEILSVFGTKFLLATDGSPESVRAARMATELSNKLGSEMHLVYVEPMPDVYGIPERVIYASDIQNHLEVVERYAQERLGEEAAKIREYGGEVAAVHPKVGAPTRRSCGSPRSWTRAS